MLTDDALMALLRDQESQHVERKASANDLDKIKRAVCAFANNLSGDRKPGVIFVGIHDDGSCGHLLIDDALLQKLAQIGSSADILPRPSIQVEKRILDGCEVAVVQVEPASAPPVRFRGRIWVRVGPTTREANAEDERVLRERNIAGHKTFDRRPCESAALSDLDLEFFRTEYLPSAVSADVLARNQRSVEEQLASLRLSVGGVPTYGALLVLGMEPRDHVPGAYVQFLRIDGEELADPIKDAKELGGPLHEIAQRLDDLLEINVSIAVDITTGSREQEVPDYPVPALQQLTRNALIHRNYETSNAPIRVYWFRDRIEIHSPGGLYGQVTPENLGKGTTDYRNPLLAEAMAHLGYVQRFGYGIPTAIRLLRENGNPPPAFESRSEAFLVTVRPRA